jgi:hypothetical protein
MNDVRSMFTCDEYKRKGNAVRVPLRIYGHLLVPHDCPLAQLLPGICSSVVVCPRSVAVVIRCLVCLAISFVGLELFLWYPRDL